MIFLIIFGALVGFGILTWLLIDDFAEKKR